MEEIRIVRRRSRVWVAVVTALAVVALIAAFVLFRDQLPFGHSSWNGMINYLPLAMSLPLFV